MSEDRNGNVKAAESEAIGEFNKAFEWEECLENEFNVKSKKNMQGALNRQYQVFPKDQRRQRLCDRLRLDFT